MQALSDQGRGMNGSTQCEGVGSKGHSPYGKTSWILPVRKGVPGASIAPRSYGRHDRGSSASLLQYTASRYLAARWRALQPTIRGVPHDPSGVGICAIPLQCWYPWPLPPWLCEPKDCVTPCLVLESPTAGDLHSWRNLIDLIQIPAVSVMLSFILSQH